MTAMILNMADFHRIFGPAEEAREQVARQIDHRVTVRILAQAQRRAERDAKAGIHPNVAAASAVSWALAQIETPPPEAA